MMVERNKYGRPVIRTEVDGNKGSSEVCWIDDGYSVPHYASFVVVPFQPAKWNYIGNVTEEQAIEKAGRDLEYRLAQCGMIQ